MAATTPTSTETEAAPAASRVSLIRTLRERDLFLLFIGSVIGSGVFLTPGLILRQLDGSVGYSFLVWIIGGALSLLGALTYAELSAANPEAAAHALTRTIPRQKLHRAAVLSDGAAALVDYGLATWEEILDILQNTGPAELIHRIRRAETSDPHGDRWPRYKISDDATAAFCLF